MRRSAKISEVAPIAVFRDGGGQIKTVGGHSQNFSIKDGFLIKKTNRAEAKFYQRLMNHEFGLSRFTPSCQSVQYIETEPRQKKHAHGYAEVIIEDLRRGFIRPLIFDIKLGTKTVSSKELRAAGSKTCDIIRKGLRMHIADSKSSSKRLGYRFVGSSTSSESRKHLGMHPDEMLEKMARKISPDDLIAIIGELEKLLDYLSTEDGRRFELIGASVLIIAESCPEAKARKAKPLPKVKLIDFAHSNIIGPNGIVMSNGLSSTPNRKAVYQGGFRHGVETLIDQLREMLDEPPLFNEK